MDNRPHVTEYGNYAELIKNWADENLYLNFN